jgi:superfamily II DNA/RNA helicase
MPKYDDDRRSKRSKHREDPYGERNNVNETNKKQKHSSRNNIDANDDTAPCFTFDEMNLKADLLKGIYSYGFENPSAIQQRAIRPMIRGRDVIAQSQSGTGKTAVFSISALQLLQATSRETQVLILSPTRELAEQTQKVLSQLGDYMNVKCHACKFKDTVGVGV